MKNKNKNRKTVKTTPSSYADFAEKYGLYGQYMAKRQELAIRLRNTRDPEERRRIINEINKVSEKLNVL